MRRGFGRTSDDLRRVYRDHVEAVYAFFAASLSVQQAEDLTSATFERVLRSWSRYDARRASERTWILAIARNLLTDHFRRASYRDALSIDEQPGLLERAVAEDELERIAASDELRTMIAPLGERAREVVALRYAADLSVGQIAQVLELSESNVYQILGRSLKALRERAADPAAPPPAT